MQAFFSEKHFGCDGSRENIDKHRRMCYIFPPENISSIPII